MQKINSSQISHCIDEISKRNCNCQLHQCIQLVKSLNQKQFDHLQELLTLFTQSYTICDQHNYPFEFYYKEEIKCKFCLHDDFDYTQIKLISRIPKFEQQAINAEININEPKIDIESNFQKIIDLLKIKISNDDQQQIIESWQIRQKFKDCVDFIKFTHSTEVHREFHNQIDLNIEKKQFIPEDNQKIDIEKLSHLLLQ